MRFMARSLAGLFLAAVTLALLAFAGLLVAGAVADRLSTERPAQPARERVFAATVRPLTPGVLTPQTVAFGEIRSRRTLELRAPQGGRVLELGEGVEDGAAVTEGQVLVRLDPAEAESARNIARAGLAEAEAEERDAGRGLVLARDDLVAAQAQVTLRQQALTRQEDLQARGVGSAAAVETAQLALSTAEQSVLSRRSALAQAEARVDRAATGLSRARIALAEAERVLADTEIRASFTGRLSDVTVVAGGLVGANERLADLIDPDRLEVAFRLSTAQFARLQDDSGSLIAAPVSVTLDVLGADIQALGRVERVGAAVGEGATGRVVYAALEGARGFRPGDFVTVAISEPPLDGVALLPATAVDSAGGVLVLGAEDRLEAATLRVLRRQGDDVIVEAGALAGREVVVERSPLLGAGIKVNPVRPEAALAPAAAPSEDETVTLSPERRAELIAFVESSTRMPEEAKARLLDHLSQDRVPAQVIARIEDRMGG